MADTGKTPGQIAYETYCARLGLISPWESMHGVSADAWELAAAAVARNALLPVLAEYAVMMSGGGMHVRNDDPEVERIYPVAEWIPHQQRHGGKVYRRRVIVVEDWEEVPAATASLPNRTTEG